MASSGEEHNSVESSKSLKERLQNASYPSSGSHQQGYDYEFVPMLDSKYECPICLLCQREPTQTTCGHRFCRDCILTWLKRESQRCPEDNSPITAADVFPDNFAKREILCLKARCPNTKHGCKAVVELSHMEEHQLTCDFRTVPCPIGCPMLLLHVDVDEHVAKECLHRIIECSLCHANFPLNRQQAHFETCSMVSMQCEFCHVNLPRQDHVRHIRECPNAIVRCPYADVGCEALLSRMHVEEHMNSTTQRHLRLLSVAHAHLRIFVNKMATIVSTSKGDHQVQEWPSSSPSSSKEGGIKAAEADGIRMDQLTLQDSGARSSSTSPSPADAAKAGGPASTSTQPEQRSLLLSSAEGLMKELFQRNVQLEQRHREQELKMGTLRQHVAECETQLTLLFERVGSMSEARFCNGVYLWKLENFSRLVHEARTVGHSRLVHSPGFYTSVFGYRVCLRLNLVTREQHNGVIGFVSLFIHLLQGPFDESLAWPFEGVISFSILDTSEQRQHITETMTTKPGLVAFQRPTTERNPKGFGYIEFVAVETLLAERYVRNDCLLIKAAIKVSHDPF